MSKYPNFIPVEIKLTKKLYPIQSDFVKWNPYQGKTQIFIPTQISLPKKISNKDNLVNSNDYNELSPNEQNFMQKVNKFIMKNSKNDKKLSLQPYGTNNYLNPFIITEAQKLFTDKDELLKFIKEQGPFNQATVYAPKQMTIIDTANFIIKTYFIVPNTPIPIVINSQKFFVKSVKEFIPKLSDSFELSDKLNCFIKMHCCNKGADEVKHKSDNFICSKSQSSICGIIPTISSTGELEAPSGILDESKKLLNSINDIKKKVKTVEDKPDQVKVLLDQLDILEEKFKQNKLVKFVDSPRIYFPESKNLKTDESLEKLMTGLVNQKLNENSKHNGCVFKFKGKSARDIIKLATTQKWVETQQELQEMAKAAGVSTSDAERKDAFKRYQEWMNKKDLNYWCYIINYVNHLKLKDGYLECEYTLALEIDKSVTSNISIKNIRENCKSGQQKLEMQKSCDAICENSKKDESIASDSKCLFCKIIMDCGFGADNQLVMKDSFGRVIKNKSTNLNLSPLDIKTSENYCGDNFDVSSNNTGAITSQCPSKIKKPSSKYSAFDKAKLEKQLKDTVVAN